MAMLPIWKRMRPGKTGISTSFARAVLMLSFVTWMALLLFGFGLIARGLGSWFSPPADSFEQAAFIAGSSLATVGLARNRGARSCALGAGLRGHLGLAVLTMAVTYLIEVEEGISRRDARVWKITTASGQPPSAPRLLERHADLDAPEEMRRALYDGRDWCASVLQSHASHPSLSSTSGRGAVAQCPASSHRRARRPSGTSSDTAC